MILTNRSAAAVCPGSKSVKGSILDLFVKYLFKFLDALFDTNAFSRVPG